MLSEGQRQNAREEGEEKNFLKGDKTGSRAW